MPYTAQDALSQDSTFRTRVRLAIVTTCINIQAEINTTSNHTNRANYAKLVLNAPDQYLNSFALACVSQNDPATTLPMTATITDANMTTVVSSVFNALAGTI